MCFTHLLLAMMHKICCPRSSNCKRRRASFPLFQSIHNPQCVAIQDNTLLPGNLLSTVAYMHEQGVVHRDLRSEDILLEQAFQARCTR